MFKPGLIDDAPRGRHLLIDDAKIVPSQRVLGRQAHTCLIEEQRRLIVLGCPLQHTNVVQRIGVAGFIGQSAFIGCARLCTALITNKNIQSRQVGEHDRVSRRMRQRLLQSALRACQIICFTQQNTQVRPCLQ